MLRVILFAIVGYLSGSVLFANLSARLFHKDILTESKDHNPGTANAFMQGGFFCGIVSLIGDLLKGYIPVYLYFRTGMGPESGAHAFGGLLGAAIVLAAPVAGHIFPVFYQFKGGKGIAVTFGCLLGLYPMIVPVLLFAAVFIFLSVVLRVSPHYCRTMTAYVATSLLLCISRMPADVCAGFFLISMVVVLRLCVSDEPREKCRVNFLWKH